MAQDPYKYFRVEARELIEQLGQGVLELEKGPPAAELVPRLLRLAHTLKGAARVVKQGEIADLAHRVEDALAPLRGSGERAARERIDGLLALLDAAGERLGSLGQPVEPAGAGATPAKPALEEAFRTVRADVAEVDELLDAVSEVSVLVSALRGQAAAVDRARRLAEILADQLDAGRGRETVHPADAPRAQRARALADEVRGLLRSVEVGLTTDGDHLDRELRQLRETAEHLRLLPAAALFPALERAARDAAQALGKDVTFVGRGAEVRLDTQVLAGVQGALVQVVRNAVAHGVEPQDQRRRAGKAAAGRVELEVARRGNRVIFVCRDDGAGVDVAAVRRAFERRGLRAPSAPEIGTDELLRLLLEGGLTTSTAVTQHSGRGIGLDVVRDALARLGGEASMRTQAGRGTTFELSVPVSLSSLRALLVEAGGTSAAIPLDTVRGAHRVAEGEVARTGRGLSIVHEGKVIPFVPLARALGGRDAASTGRRRAWSAVVVGNGAALAAVGVDRLLGTSAVVLRPLPALAPSSAVVAGAALDAEGNPRIVLDADGLATWAENEQRGEPAEEPAPRAPILIVDDSLTTRMLEQSILESAGYEVDMATSGEEGLEKAHQRRFALFLVDVEMPGMDGFTFIERAAADPALREVPAILVTSRASPEDRRRGRDVGARAYVVKGDFDQAGLLATIRELVG